MFCGRRPCTGVLAPDPGACPHGWLAKRYTSVSDLRGILAITDSTNQAGYDRAGYVRVLRDANSAQLDGDRIGEVSPTVKDQRCARGLPPSSYVT